MRTRRTQLLGLAMTVLATVAVLTSTARAAGTPYHPAGTPGYGCPNGAYCIYPENSFNWDTGPEQGRIYTTYGVHHLHNEVGWHLTYDNQYAVNGVLAGVSLCTGDDGDGSLYNYREYPGGIGIQLGPVNSITLWLDDTHYDDSGLMTCQY